MFNKTDTSKYPNSVKIKQMRNNLVMPKNLNKSYYIINFTKL